MQQPPRHAGQETATGFGRLRAVFERPGYAWFWANMLCSWGAMILDGLASGWLVLELTESPLWLGIMIGIGGGVNLVLGLFTGALADRFDRRKLMMWGQALPGLVALGLGLLVHLELVTIGMVLAAAFIRSVAGSVQGPARNSLMPDLVPKDRLVSANALNFMALGLVRIPFAIAGGLLIKFLGISACYFLAAAVTIVAVALLTRLPRPAPQPRRGPLLSTAWEGLNYSLRNRQVRSLVFLSVVTEGFGYSHGHLLPVIARNVLQVGSTGLGYLSAAGAAGQLACNLVLASRQDIRAKGWLTIGAAMGYGLVLLGFALSPWFALSLVLIFLASAIGIAYDVGLVSLLQGTVPDQFRGRVMGAYSQSLSANGLGGLQAGAVANVMGAPFAIGVGGVLVAVNAARLLPLARQLNQTALGRSAESSPVP